MGNAVLYLKTAFPFRLVKRMRLFSVTETVLPYGTHIVHMTKKVAAGEGFVF